MANTINTEKIREEIIRLEGVRIDAILKKDERTLQELFDENLLYVHGLSGRLDTKKSYIDGRINGKPDYKSLVMSNITVRVFGDCAISTGDLVMVTASRADLRFTNVWIRSEGNWRSVHWVTVKNPANSI